MNRYRFAACEQSFPVWGSFAIQMAHEAGFSGIQITDGGGYLQPHPLNNGFVEYERLGLDLRRKDSFPLTHRMVQEDYLEAAERYDVQIMGIYLYLLDHQGFVKFSDRTPQGQQCLETIKNAIVSASQMPIPSVTIPTNGMFGVAQHTYAFQKLAYAARLGQEYGVQVLTTTDTALERQREVVDKLDGQVTLEFSTIGPMIYAKGSAPEMIRSLGAERIGCFRVSDLAASPEGFVTKEEGIPVLLGQGDGLFGQCAAAIRDTGYAGWIVSATPYYSRALATEPGQDVVPLAAKDVQTLERTFNGEGER